LKSTGESIHPTFAYYTDDTLRFEKVLSIRWFLVVLALSAFLVGPRKPYFVFNVAKASVGLMVILNIGPRYWGGGSTRTA
jgi:hypothetical protein